MKHPADRMPLKLRITRPDEASVVQDGRPILSGDMSLQAARQQLSALEPRLAEALEKDAPESLLVRRYYLPMLEAAVKLNDPHRAKSYRQKIVEEDVPKADLPDWWHMNCRLDFALRRLGEAEKWAGKLLEWSKKTNNERRESQALHAFGMIAQKRRDFQNAEKWYRKSLDIKEKHGNEHGAAITYHQLGSIAQERRDFQNAEKWYRKSLDIEEKHGNEHGAAITYHNLGMIAQERRDFQNAEKWYRKSLDIEEKHGDEHSAAITYHQLGSIAEERRDFKNAEKWYRKSLDIKEKHGDEHSAALTYSIGNMAAEQGQFEESAQWLIKSIGLFAKQNDPYITYIPINNFRIIYEKAPPDEQKKMKAMWEEAGLGELPLKE